MYQPELNVLTLEETAHYLKLSSESIEKLAQNNHIPGRKIDETWRFWRPALDDWLKGETQVQAELEDKVTIAQVKQLSLLAKIKLLHILAAELEAIFPFEPNKVYQLPTPYNMFGAGKMLMQELKNHAG